MRETLKITCSNDPFKSQSRNCLVNHEQKQFLVFNLKVLHILSKFLWFGGKFLKRVHCVLERWATPHVAFERLAFHCWNNCQGYYRGQLGHELQLKIMGLFCKTMKYTQVKQAKINSFGVCWYVPNDTLSAPKCCTFELFCCTFASCFWSRQNQEYYVIFFSSCLRLFSKCWCRISKCCVVFLSEQAWN